jgi:UDP-N-acetylmuramate dehydrogenase
VRGAELTTFAIGGPLQYFIEPQSIEELQEIVRRTMAARIPYRVLGAGSNLLISSRGVGGLTIRLGKGFRTTEPEGSQLIRAGASVSLMTLSRTLSDQGLSGLEFAGGIPASLGGAVAMNAGAHGGQMADVIEAVEVLLADGTTTRLPASELNFQYRSASLPKGSVVFSVWLRLAEGSPERCSRLRAEFLAHRKATQPLQSPCAGSVFKNPNTSAKGDGVAAGKLLEEVGVKALREGGASVSSLHANWIVNDSRAATSDDVWRLVRRCQDAVKDRWDIWLEPEIIPWE